MPSQEEGFCWVGSNTALPNKLVRAAIEEVMLEIMYEVPSLKNVKSCTITKDVVLNKKPPILSYYKECNLLHEINGMNKIDQIYGEICQIINLMDT